MESITARGPFPDSGALFFHEDVFCSPSGCMPSFYLSATALPRGTFLKNPRPFPDQHVQTLTNLGFTFPPVLFFLTYEYTPFASRRIWLQVSFLPLRRTPCSLRAFFWHFNSFLWCIFSKGVLFTTSVLLLRVVLIKDTSFHSSLLGRALYYPTSCPPRGCCRVCSTALPFPRGLWWKVCPTKVALACSLVF